MKQSPIHFCVVIWIFFLGIFLCPNFSSAATTTGGVNWLDPLGYTKPAFYPLTVPDEASAPRKWYVDLSGGSGTSCTQGAPCVWGSVAAKAGVGDGTGSYIYIKGTGSLSDIVLVGAAGAEVVIKPWDDATQATVTGRNNWTTAKQHVIFDGGPNLRIKFSSTSGSQFDPSIYFNANGATTHSNITFYRTQWHVPGGGEWVAQWGQFTNLKFINSEFYATGSSDTGNQHHLYFSGASNFGGSTGLSILNNIFRDTPGESIEFRIFQTFTDTLIEGNAFHNVGKGTCGTGWGCRSAATFASSGGSFTGTFRVANNLIWNTGENCIRTWDNPTTTQIFNNTCYLWGNGTSATGAYSSAGFANYSFNSSVPGDFRNNILYATGNDANGNTKTPFPNNTSIDSFNACTSSTNCGTSKQTISASSFQSLDENSVNFLKLVPGATPINTGTTLAAVTTDYFGTSRPVDSIYDIGAFEYSAGSSDTIPPATPTGLGVL